MPKIFNKDSRAKTLNDPDREQAKQIIQQLGLSKADLPKLQQMQQEVQGQGAQGLGEALGVGLGQVPGMLRQAAGFKEEKAASPIDELTKIIALQTKGAAEKRSQKEHELKIAKEERETGEKKLEESNAQMELVNAQIEMADLQGDAEAKKLAMQRKIELLGGTSTEVGKPGKAQPPEVSQEIASKTLAELEAPVQDVAPQETTDIQQPAPIATAGKAEEFTSGATPLRVTTGGKIKTGDVTRDIKDVSIKSLEQKLDKMTATEIARSSLEPKLGFMMDIGSRAYRELSNEAAKKNIALDFDKGGFEFWKAKVTKAGLSFARLAPLMDAVDKLRPEIGFEVMRQIGPFRSAHAGLVFTETLPDFSGHVPTDIARAVTTQTKSYAGGLGNKALVLDAIGREIPPEEQFELINQYEANLIRNYNKMFRGMGASKEFYGVGQTAEWVADNSVFTPTEQGVISSFQKKYPERSMREIVITLIDEGLI